MTVINIPKTLDELKNEVDEYDIKPLMLKVIKSKFYATYGICPDEKVINLGETIADSIYELAKKYIITYGSLETTRLFYQFYPYQYAYRADENKYNRDLILHHYSNLSNSSILEIVRYGIYGVFDKDLSVINKLLDEHNPRITYDSRMWLLSIEKVTIKSFKNGKVVVSGLTNEQRNRIINGFETVAKYRNVTI